MATVICRAMGICWVMIIIMMSILLFPEVSTDYVPPPSRSHPDVQQTGIIAFDCNQTSLDVMTFDLSRVSECKAPPSYNISEEPLRVQIIQAKDHDLLMVRRCHIVAHTLMFHCGMHHHSTIANYDFAPVPLMVSRQDCVQAHESHSMYLDGLLITQIAPNATSRTTRSLAGDNWGEGYCNGGTYTFGGYTYKNIVVKRTYVITLAEQMQYYRVGTQDVMSFSGLVCRLAEASCYDYEVGRVYWTQTSTDCATSRYESLYAGSAVKLLTSNLGPQTTYVKVQPDGMGRFQLFTPLLTEESVCGLEAWTTPYVGLYIIQYRDRPPIPTRGPLAPNVDINRYIEAKLMTYAYGAALTTADIVQRLAIAQCETHRETLLNRLHIIAANPSSANLLLDNQPGVFGRVAGEVIHILQCPAVEVSLRRSEECTLEIPISFKGRPLYMDARTRIITDVWTYKDCGVLTPVMFRHGDHWIKMVPGFTPANAPATLEPTLVQNLRFERLISFAQGGIYDPADLQQLRNFMLFSTRRDAMSANFLAGIEGKNAPKYDITQVMQDSGWKAISERALEKTWGVFKGIGAVVNGLVGIYFCYKLVALVVGAIIRGYSIYQLVGWSWQILAAFWSGLTGLVVARKLARPPTTDAATGEDLPMIPLRSQPPTGSVPTPFSQSVYPILNQPTQP